jgi:hypothetical protein
MLLDDFHRTKTLTGTALNGNDRDAGSPAATGPTLAGRSSSSRPKVEPADGHDGSDTPDDESHDRFPSSPALLPCPRRRQPCAAGSPTSPGGASGRSSDAGDRRPSPRSRPGCPPTGSTGTRTSPTPACMLSSCANKRPRQRHPHHVGIALHVTELDESSPRPCSTSRPRKPVSSSSSSSSMIVVRLFTGGDAARDEAPSAVRPFLPAPPSAARRAGRRCPARRRQSRPASPAARAGRAGPPPAAGSAAGERAARS